LKLQIKLLPENTTDQAEISTIDVKPLGLTDPRRRLRNDQESITNQAKNQMPYQELVFGENSKSEPIRERFGGELKQYCSKRS
jgi:hypothetical protein